MSGNKAHENYSVITWIDRNILDLGRQLRWSYLPPLMVYLAAGISGLTGIVGTFFVKDYLGLSAEFLASLGFWTMLPWTLKMPLGHLVDLVWRRKAGLIYLGAALITASLLIMCGLIARPDMMRELLPIETWYVWSVMLSPAGYVLQDTVADAMTVEAVSKFDDTGKPRPAEELRLAHTTMQTLGRVAIVGGTLLVAAANVYLFSGVEGMSAADKAATYLRIYQLALAIPVVSVAGTVLAALLRRHQIGLLAALGHENEAIERMLGQAAGELRKANWGVLGGGLGFTVFAVIMGVASVPFNEEIVFAGSMTIVMFLIWKLTQPLERPVRHELLGTALVIFAFRAAPTPGAGSTWWMIDELHFDQQFLSQLSLVSSFLALLGMFLFRRFMAERSITYVMAFLTITLSVLFLPNLALYYGLHEWTAAHTGGIVNARFIALVDTALESPLGQVAMIPMLAWIANSAPAALKATYFAVMAAFVNLALSLAQLITKYLNQWYVIKRQVIDGATGAVITPADYTQLGGLYWVVFLLGLAMPLAAIAYAKRSWLRAR